MKKGKAGLALSLVLAAGTLLSACGSSESTTSDGGNSEGKKVDFKVGMVTDTGGVDDKSFNQSAWEGLTKFGQENGLEEGKGFKYLQSGEASEYQSNLSTFAESGFNVTYGIGFLLKEDVKVVAGQNPDINFGLVDDSLKAEGLDNVASILFKEEQGSFLVGVIAAKHTKSNKVGFIGGVESPLIKKFENGFKAGVKSVNPDAEVVVQYAEDFNNSAKGTTIASAMYSQGADIIYHAAGGTGVGVFTEAKNRKKKGEDVWVIGVDRDQHEEGLPENVTLTSMVKRVDVAVYEVSKRAMEGDFPGGEEVVFGLEEDGVSIAPTTENVSEEALKVVEEYEQKILGGDIEVPATDEAFETFLTTLK
ncbi:BMP family lipoprotein [Metabacillus iocasae]|uniref:Basic membrane protein A n=1 Tax=Priestia iocasae TaxID=2291674 RepID=A0ABS2QT43_9BACI|nr:BMP family protein [Metabacillus iocasae]MBM7701926.1 basic membrane protein A [Metabacillus iocasae]